jgi:hypothetical protein
MAATVIAPASSVGPNVLRSYNEPAGRPAKAVRHSASTAARLCARCS